MKKQITTISLALVLLLAFLPLCGFAAEDSTFADTGAVVPGPTDVSTDEGITAVPSENYKNLQTDLKQDSLTSALRRIQALEQENRFQTRRIELLERNVDDLKNDNSRRSFR